MVYLCFKEVFRCSQGVSAISTRSPRGPRCRSRAKRFTLPVGCLQEAWDQWTGGLWSAEQHQRWDINGSSTKLVMVWVMFCLSIDERGKGVRWREFAQTSAEATPCGSTKTLGGEEIAVAYGYALKWRFETWLWLYNIYIGIHIDLLISRDHATSWDFDQWDLCIVTSQGVAQFSFS